MSAHSSLDRETFQTLLANAFAVQGSGMNKHSLSGLIEIHKAIAKDELSFEKILDLIADRARIVADATGIAIGLLSGNQLVYRAGTGSGAPYIGQHVRAVLSASGRTGPRKEILRVDNAENDPRIEAVICREFDTKALLIIPIYNGNFMAGVLEVLFRDPHSFDDGETRAYRMMAKLVEDAMAHHLHNSQGKRATHSTTQPSVGKTPFLMQRGPRTDGKGARGMVPSAIPTRRSPTMQSASTKRLPKGASFRDPPWIFDASVLVIILVLAGWISLRPHVASTMQRLSQTRTTASGEYAHKGSVNNLSKPSGTHQTNEARPRFTRFQIGPNEVDYVAEDVTIRQFKKPVRSSHPPAVAKQFDIGDDVTVRTYKYKAEVLPENRSFKTDALHSAATH